MNKLIVFIPIFIASALFAGTNLNRAEILYYNIGASETAMGSASGSLDNNVSAGIMNPAAIATVQQLKFSTMFGDLAGNCKYFYLGSAIPTSRGILGASFRYFGADSQSFLDQAVGGSLSWAKMFTDNLYLGLGLKYFQLNFQKTNSYPQIGLDVGGIYRKNLEINTQKNFNFKSYSIGASILNIGVPIKNKTIDKVVSIPFQIKAGPSFRFGMMPDYDLGLALDLTLANFTKFKFNVGVENELFKKYYINIGYLFNSDLNQLSLGAAYKFNIKTLEGKVSMVFLPGIKNDSMLFLGIDAAIGTIDTTPPKADIQFEENKGTDTIYISPNYDGAQDSVTIDMNVKDNTQLRDWEVAIVDEQGTIVKKYVSPDIRALKGKLTFMKVMGKMIEKKKEVPVPQKIVWDGKNDAGQPVKDGAYKIVLTARDENKNTTKTAAKTIVIDTVAPKAEIKSDLMLFSPNGDGVKDTVSFSLNTEKKADWNGQITDDKGKSVRQYAWKDSVPDSKIVWDGTDESGKIVPNGIYSFTIKAVDKAGNTVEKKLPNITLTTNKDAAAIDADVNIFSPNLDGVFDTVTFTPMLSSDKGLNTWELDLMDDTRTVVKQFKGSGKFPAKIVWDGTDNNGKIVKDGNYFYQFKAEYASGNHPETFVKGVIVDNSAPKTEFSLSAAMISPDGRGKNEAENFSIKVKEDNGIQNWKLEIVDEKNSAVKSFSGSGNPAAQISWAGIKGDGSLAKGGEIYYSTFTVTDIVGNKYVSDKKMIQIDPTPPDVSMSVKYRIFSPDNDGEADVQEFKFSRFDKKLLKNWNLSISLFDKNTKNEVLFKTFIGTNLPETLVWNGLSDNGQLVKGGDIYKVKLRVEDVLANATNLRDQFAIDSTPPDVDIKLDPVIFSPDDDGVNDIENITLYQRDKKKVGPWKLEIFPIRDDKDASLFKSFSGTNMPAHPLVWNGFDNSGTELVESAMDYDVVLTASDVLGNVTTVKNILSVDILIIKMPYGLKIKISNIGFEYDSFELKGDRTLKILTKVAKIVSKYKTYKVEVQGHTSKDSAASGADYNQKLSEKRAKSVMDYLVKQGLFPDQLRAAGKGFTMPAFENDTEEHKAKNRRSEFLLYKDGWPAESATGTGTTKTNK